MSLNASPRILDNDLTGETYENFASAERIAWDIETSGLDWRSGRIGTCQLHAPEVGTYIVKISDHRPARLISLLGDRRVRKVFHYAPFDLRWMVGHWHASPAGIDCTKLASRLNDKTEDSSRHSLKFLLHEHLGIDLDKTQRLSNWLTSTLSEEQVNYAAADVIFLLPLLDELNKRLADAGHLDLYRRCAEFLPTRVELEVGAWPDVFGY